MLKKIFAIAILVSFSFAASPQQSSASKKKHCGCSFSSINQVGLLAGEKNEAFQFQTINGLQYRTWMVGAGVGIDGYRFRSIPLFLHLRKEFNLKSNAIFIYNDIGFNYPWLKTEQKRYWGPAADYDHGIYYDGGVGYKILMKRNAVVFSGGFSLKEFSEGPASNLCPFSGPCYDQTDRYYYSLKRITLKLGVQL
jgi:hypothetical protein